MKISRSALLTFSAKNMYDVVADVRSYPDFLNWCKGVNVISESPQEAIAELIIAYGVLDFSFTTRNAMSKDARIQLSLVDGPFSSFQGQWEFAALSEQASKVTLEMDFRFDNPITHKVFSGVFQKVVNTQFEAFQKRAQALYGERELDQQKHGESEYSAP